MRALQRPLTYDDLLDMPDDGAGSHSSSSNSRLT